MSGLILTVTNAGRAALVNLPNTGTNAVLMASVGVSATSFTPSPATASLPGEIKRISTIAGEAVANDTIHVTVRDESNAVYTVRSFGLYLSDGTLFAVYSQTNPIMEKSAQAMLLLAIDVAFADINANQISFGDTSFINPPATTERQGVVELATDAEATTGTDATRAITPKGLKGAVTSWLDSRFGSGAPSTFVKGLLTSASATALRLSLGLKSAALKDEGAGKGLDADLLDGEHGDYYKNIPARLGYTPANKAGDTFTGDVSVGARILSAKGIRAAGEYGAGASSYLDTGIEIGGLAAANRAFVYAYDRQNLAWKQLQLAGSELVWTQGGSSGSVPIWHAGNDGAGSALDAGLLGGFTPSQYVGPASVYHDYAAYGLKVVRGGYYGIHFGETLSATAAMFNAEGFGGFYQRQTGASGPARWLLYTDGSDWFTGPQIAQGKIWHAGNDGAGSGLDADLLDGVHASSFLQIIGDAQDIYTRSTAAGSALKFREVNLVSTNQSAAIYAPRLRFAWGGRFIRDFGMDWSGTFTAWTEGSGGYAPIRAENFYAGSNIVWNAGNDGAGSGLDADLLDGQQSSYYTNIVARLGYTPANRAGDTFTGDVITDAGVLASKALRAVGDYATAGADRLGTGIELGGSAANNRGFIYAYDRRNTVWKTLQLAGSDLVWTQGGTSALLPIWHSGNDGAGSGLDADMLDGLHASSFQRVTSQNMAALNGYRVYADGTKECWTSLTIAQHSNATWTLPVAHTDFVHPSFAISTANGITDVQDNTGITSINGAPPVSITFWNADNRTITIWVRTIGR